ncbi:MAG: cysteine hydrolase [Desulfovibrionaceae bacterium]|nr:cysteine hydrolase [Desulfovibrionaceae bacterium]
MTRTALMIIDMQQDFVYPSSPLCVAGAASTVPLIQKILEFARSQKWPVIHIIREHHPFGTDIEKSRSVLFHDGKGICIPGSEGWQVIPQLKPEKEEFIIRKRRFSAFFGTELDMVLRRLGIERILVTGTQYPNCIRSTVVDGMSLDYDMVVVTDACSARTDQIASNNVDDIRNMGITCLPAAELEDLRDMNA